ncbi:MULTISPECIES: dihydrolipoamide acetyltransferase family protein [Pelosinus]|uniref:Dihydrolipoamide acetyltransferase component of pyruvate dehydrogenase complex n=1 Tax=Pelosinus fermentans B4 TaxID=1149862 RepID=I9B4M9_9FIRM|nr:MULTISPECIES: dihydrolipoamide acetyltransferase family protein [Pelosinus]EIW20102.1 catalytic domain-containing protein [Pelosinus fermentans B4]EIW26153.1 catalytic domain-containing protein [Pelosinus fermentans A11]OAM93092.1 Dihydrolipoyllysine-residue acetyltransferase [Pelosinus fermentans DSM 17108]SDQ66810.1 pyruvate dehydrogenase E2 component (dihydrolipoamide acetyltransferase) [Pelosinus fermentans]
MATELLMPKLGMTMEEGTIVTWFKKVGESVAEGEILLEILTDKVNMEVEAPAAGQVLAIIAAEGDIVEVNKPIAYIGQPGEKVESHAAEARKTEEQHTAQVAATTPAPVQSAEGIGGKVKASPAAKRIAREEEIDLRAVPPSGPGGRIIAVDVTNYKASPLAQKIAQDKGVDLAEVTGTGIGGKIVKADVENAVTKLGSKTKGVRKPLAGMRKVIADHMADAWAAPHVTHNMEVDMSGMVELRKKLIPGIEKRIGVKPSYNDLIIKVVAKALREYQQVINARLHSDGLEICDEVNVGMAVALPNGLVVPVIKNADTLSIEEITKRAKELATQAKEGKLLPDEMSGGTFTVTNLGMYGIDTFSPIVNAPEVCILGVGQLQDKVVAKAGEMIIQPRMSLSLSFDHRAVDGAQAAEFLRRIKELLEDYLQLI